MEHSFNVDIAVRYGIRTAIILNNLNFWIKKNESNEKHFHEGRYWTYNSIRAFTRLFPYWTERQIQEELRKMEEQGLILKGNFNENAYDRTCWYALTDFANTILQSRVMVDTDSVDDARTSLLDTDINTDNRVSSTQSKQSLKDILGIQPKDNSQKSKKKEAALKKYASLVVSRLQKTGCQKLFYEFLGNVYDKGQLREDNVNRLIVRFLELWEADSHKAEDSLAFSKCKGYAEIFDNPNYTPEKARSDRPKAVAEMTPEERAEYEKNLADEEF